MVLCLEVELMDYFERDRPRGFYTSEMKLSIYERRLHGAKKVQLQISPLLSVAHFAVHTVGDTTTIVESLGSYANRLSVLSSVSCLLIMPCSYFCVFRDTSLAALHKRSSRESFSFQSR